MIGHRSIAKGLRLHSSWSDNLKLFLDNYAYTKKDKQYFKSPKWIVSGDKELSLQIWIALCETCQMIITLQVDQIEETLHVVNGTTTHMIEKLPAWQQIAIKTDIRKHEGKMIQLIIKSQLNGNASKKIWAVGALYQHEPLGL